ncbi:MAG TPA: ribosome silencing factor [Nitrospiria bacterium]
MAAEAALEKQAIEVVVLNVKKFTDIADYFLICSGDSERQVKAISDHIEGALKEEKEIPFSVEGLTYLNWVLLDYNDIVVHIFKQESRLFYNLERLWGDAPRLTLPQDPLRKPAIGSEQGGQSSHGFT